jgi:hypothetical protein
MAEYDVGSLRRIQFAPDAGRDNYVSRMTNGLGTISGLTPAEVQALPRDMEGVHFPKFESSDLKALAGLSSPDPLKFFNEIVKPTGSGIPALSFDKASTETSFLDNLSRQIKSQNAPGAEKAIEDIEAMKTQLGAGAPKPFAGDSFRPYPPGTRYGLVKRANLLRQREVQGQETVE